MHGVQPKAKAKPRRKPLKMPGLVSWLRRWHVAIEPAGELRAEEADDGERKEVAGAESGEERSAAEQCDDAERHEHHAEYEAGAEVDSHQGRRAGEVRRE